MKDNGGGYELQILEANSGPPPFDADKYRAELRDGDITDEQATEFLRALDFILRSFVDLGWGVDSVQNIFPELKEFSALADSSGLQIESKADDFNNAASHGKGEGDE